MPRNSWRTAFASCKLECGIVWWPAPLFQPRQFVGARVSVHERARCILALRVLVALARCHAFPTVCTIACALVRASMCMCACFVRERASACISSSECTHVRFIECARVCVGSGSAFRLVSMFSLVFASVLASVCALRLSPTGGALDAVAGVFEHAPVGQSEPRRDVEETSAFMQRLGTHSAPVSPLVGRTVDPEKHHALASCDRDFDQSCPDQFVSVGAGKCAPSSGYHGPCSGDARGFGALSDAAKERWSGMCLAWWPCTRCRLDFSDLCPRQWVVESGTVCKPTATYAGPCSALVDFAGYSRDMLAQWSANCGAHWPCASGGSIAGA